ncbi:MAG: amino acid ABC transporter substrate-binding protein [Puniceicoccaceae bacterium]|nr:MAG: amino acid ABC transporter substrate-binding protein [Puniceicoccaceae bacterium]
MSRIRFFTTLLLAAALLIAGCGPSAGDRPLVVGMELAYPPFEMTDERGRPTGVSVDLARALAEHLGRELVIENIPFDGLIPSLRTGKIDLIISSMTATEARARSIAFSDPYLRTGLCLLVAADSEVDSIEDLRDSGRVVAVKRGTTGHIYATERLAEARLRVVDRESSAVLEVAQGKVDAFIYDQMSTWSHWQRNRSTTRALLDPFQEEFWAVGLRQGDDELRAEVNAFLRTFRERGGFDDLGDRYLAEQKAAFRELGLPFLF